jgi:uncharacterized protein (TIGR02246 family)
LPSFAQQKDAVDPKVAQQVRVLASKFDGAFNRNDAAAVAEFYTDDGFFVTSEGPKYGREAIGKCYADLFRQFHFSNYFSEVDQYSPRLIGTAGNETVEIGEWGCTIEGHGGSPIQLKGNYTSIYIHTGKDWKISMVTSNMTQLPASRSDEAGVQSKRICRPSGSFGCTSLSPEREKWPVAPSPTPTPGEQ